jgi:hypothetical protein
MDCDISLMMTTLEYGLNYLSTCWSAMGRPIITLIMGDNMLGSFFSFLISRVQFIRRGQGINFAPRCNMPRRQL